jgi:signal transduction histidine kinase
MVYQNYDVVSVARESLLVVEQSNRTKAAFELDITEEAYVVRTDAQRLKQVFMNLLTNAAKFTRDGSIRIGMKVDKEESMIIFSVTDTGCGIPKEKAEKVFERFEKLDEYVQGTGLGLSITRLIVEKLGGKIWIDTTYTQGARFVFTHPL